MNISFSWLRDYLKTDLSAAEVGEKLTRSGIEVKAIHSFGVASPHIVAAQILESVQHPNADRLSVCKVDDGSGMPRQIVCGAKNYKVGDKVLLALPGAVLPGDFKIKVGKLRGVESEGMMCSAKELNLGEGVEGLLILPPATAIGTVIGELFPADDIFEIEITPNRPDWLGHIGVAREAAAFGAGDFIWQSPSLTSITYQEDQSKVAIEDLAACPFYSFQKIEGVGVKASPAWLSRRLESIGANAVNTIVDAANEVMFATAQPLHAFDADKIKLPLTVRFAKPGETLLALDGKSYELTPEDLVIADQQGTQALAGVIGGMESSVTETTTSILLEAAVFNPSLIRKSARTHAILTDAAYRFERGSDATIAKEASLAAARFIKEVAGGTISEEIIVAGAEAKQTPIALRNERCCELLGVSLSDEKIAKYLNALGLKLENGAWTIPAWRHDLTREVDLIEEIARLHGIEHIESRLIALPTSSTEADKAYDVAMTLRQKLVGHGFFEIRTGTLISQEATHWEQSEEPIALRNPMGEQQSMLRNNLFSGLATVIHDNSSHGATSLKFFEIGKVFSSNGVRVQFLTKTSSANPNPTSFCQELHPDPIVEEDSVLGIMMTGWADDLSWRASHERSLDLYDLKGLVDQLLPGKISYRLSSESASLFALKLDIFCNDQPAGFIAILSPAEARKLIVTGKKHPVVVAELKIDLFQKRIATESWRSGAALSKFPTVTRDFSLVLENTISYGKIEELLVNARESLLQSVFPFDLFSDPEGIKVPAGKKSIAICLTFQHAERTLTADEVSKACERLMNKLKEELEIEIRC